MVPGPPTPAAPLNDELEEISMRGVRGRSVRSRAAVGAVAALLLAVTACGGGSAAPPAAGAASAGPDGVDDGTTLTLWTRAPLEKQANLLVDAYNASHRNKVELTVVPNDDYVAKVGAAAGSDSLPDLFAADIVYVPSWAEQGLFQDLTDNVAGLPFADTLNAGHMSAGTVDDRRHVLPFVLDLSMLFWNKDLFREAGPRWPSTPPRPRPCRRWASPTPTARRPA
jgi:multiple sugar transport system substrate-binding protein